MLHGGQGRRRVEIDDNCREASVVHKGINQGVVELHRVARELTGGCRGARMTEAACPR
jgi:hypothetical protein